MNAIVNAAGFGPLAPQFQNKQVTNDLSAGVETGFGRVSIEGRTWTPIYRGKATKLLRPDGSPLPNFEFVIVKASSVKSKTFYENGFEEGNKAPTCSSTNGVTPDIGVAKKQSATCALCPQNAWGARITPAGKQGKACSDSKRVVVVPRADIKNEAFGGGMLLRIPAASLSDMAQYGQKLAAIGYPYYSVGTEMSFDYSVPYQKLKFQATSPLTPEEADLVIAMQDDPQTARILAEGETAQVSAPPEAPTPASVFLNPPPPAPAASFPVVERAVTPEVRAPEIKVAATGFTAAVNGAAPPAQDDFEKALEAKMNSIMG